MLYFFIRRINTVSQHVSSILIERSIYDHELYKFQQQQKRN